MPESRRIDVLHGMRLSIRDYRVSPREQVRCTCAATITAADTALLRLAAAERTLAARSGWNAAASRLRVLETGAICTGGRDTDVGILFCLEEKSPESGSRNATPLLSSLSSGSLIESVP